MNFVKATDFEIMTEKNDGTWNIYVDGYLWPLMVMTREQALWVADGIRLSLSHPDQFGIRFAKSGFQFTVSRWKDWIVFQFDDSTSALSRSEATIFCNALQETVSKLPPNAGCHSDHSLSEAAMR